MARRLAAALLLSFATFLSAAPAGALTFSFDDPGLDFEHGRIVTDQYAFLGLQIFAENQSEGPDHAVIFDTRLAETRDPDLEFGAESPHGHILVIQENGEGCGDGVCDLPDDEGSRPAGTLSFLFDEAIRSFGFDLFDVEDPESGGSITFFASAEGGSFMQVGSTVYFSDLIDPDSPFYREGVAFGDHSANTILPLGAEELGSDAFSFVKIRFGGSGGVDDLRVGLASVPEPGTFPMLAAGLTGLVILGRRRRPRP